MNKSMLCAGLMTVLYTTAYAENSGAGVNPDNMNGPQAAIAQGIQTPSAQIMLPDSQRLTAEELQIVATQDVQTPSTPAALGAGTETPAAPDNPTPGTSTPATPGIPTPATPGTPTPATPGTPTPATPGTPTPATPGTQMPATPGTQMPAAPGTQMPAAPGIQTPTAPAPAQPLDCTYRIPAETNRIEQTVVMKWAEKAAAQSFDFDHSVLDKQLSSLKACYTEQGWVGFKDALEKSGNLNAIKSQNLIVSSMINGEGKIIEIKENQWKVILPMQVVYQNDKEKLTQPLTVNLVVGRKVSGDLGIMQMIAIPQQANSTSNPKEASDATGTPSTSPTTAPSQQQPLQH